jgi:hypothetical protein
LRVCTDENGAILVNTRAQSGSMNATRGLNARGLVGTSDLLAVQAEAVGSLTKRLPFFMVPMQIDAGGAIAVADNTISGSPGTLTPLANLHVLVNENKTLLVTYQTKGSLKSAPKPLAQTKARTDALGRLVVAEG